MHRFEEKKNGFLSRNLLAGVHSVTGPDEERGKVNKSHSGNRFQLSNWGSPRATVAVCEYLKNSSSRFPSPQPLSWDPGVFQISGSPVRPVFMF